MRTKALCSWLALNYGRTARARTNLPKNLPELDLAPWLLYLLSGPKLCLAGGLPYDFTILHLSDSFRLFQLSIGFPLDFHALLPLLPLMSEATKVFGEALRFASDDLQQVPRDLGEGGGSMTVYGM